MEDPTSFELNHAIRNWQDGLRRSPHFRAEDLVELEAHVRDSTAAFRAKGLTDEEAFLLATRRVGTPSGLEPEFAKVNRTEVWLNRLLWMSIGIQVWGWLGALSRIGADAVILGGMSGLGVHLQGGGGGWSWSHAVPPVAFMSLAYLLALAAILAGCWRIVHRKEREAGRLVSRAAGRPVATGLVVGLAGLVVLALGYMETFLMLRLFPLSEIGTFSNYKIFSSALVSVAQTLTFVALTIVLLRRRFRHLALASK